MRLKDVLGAENVTASLLYDSCPVRALSLIKRIGWERKVCAAMLIQLLLFLVQSSDVIAQDYNYVTNSDNSITITGYTGSGGDATIPDAIDGLTVTSIRDGAFFGCTTLTSMTIPESVIVIGLQAFYNCTSLTNVTIPNSVTFIGDLAFWNCSSLTSVTIPDSVAEILGGGEGQGTFSFCTSLTSVTIPDNVITIGEDAFLGCSSLTNVTIGKGLTSVGDGAFSGCTNLTVIEASQTNSAFSSLGGVLFDKNQTTIIIYPEGKTNGTYTVPISATNIAEDAFYYCQSLTSITVPGNVVTIGADAFDCCTTLTGVFFEGNAPNFDSDDALFMGDANATVYYLPGTTGWSNNFDGQPTSLWRPQLCCNPTSFIQSNQFGFNINWASGMICVVESCTNLLNPIWSPLYTNALVSNSCYFSVPSWTNSTCRFYRLRSL
jgi:hypothetical protein